MPKGTPRIKAKRLGACSACDITLPWQLRDFVCELTRCPGVGLVSESRTAEVDESGPRETVEVRAESATRSRRGERVTAPVHAVTFTAL